MSRMLISASQTDYKRNSGQTDPGPRARDRGAAISPTARIAGELKRLSGGLVFMEKGKNRMATVHDPADQPRPTLDRHELKTLRYGHFRASSENSFCLPG